MKTASAMVPAGVSFEEAAALGIAGLSAWIPLVEKR
jgi:NADPH:quinone reductase-like Zn-dependent oxidoreductase